MFRGFSVRGLAFGVLRSRDLGVEGFRELWVWALDI